MFAHQSTGNARTHEEEEPLINKLSNNLLISSASDIVVRNCIGSLQVPLSCGLSRFVRAGQTKITSISNASMSVPCTKVFVFEREGEATKRFKECTVNS